MTDIASPYYCRDIETAVSHPLWNEEERESLIASHNRAMGRETLKRDPLAAIVVEWTSGE